MNFTTMSQPFEILLLEDNPGDIELIREAFQESRINYRLSVVRDGEAAIAFLHRQGKYTNAPRADLILLDLNVPKIDGRQVLAEIKNDPYLRRIPVIVLSTSAAEQDVLESYELHANCYITKPIDFEHFIAIVKAVENFWLDIVKLPPK